MKKIKKVLSLLLTIIILLSTVSTASLSAYASNYNSDYRKWSQGNSSDSWMRSSGCGIVAYSKLLYDCGIAYSVSGFNPDVFYKYCKNKGYVNNSGFTSGDGENAVVNYAKSLNNNFLSYEGKTTSNCKNKIKENVYKGGYYTLVRIPGSSGKGHFVLVDNYHTRQSFEDGKNKIYVYESYSSSGQLEHSYYSLNQSIIFVKTFKYKGIWLKEVPTTTPTYNSCTIKGVINAKTPISKWGYYISTDKSALSNFNGAVNTDNGSHSPNPAKNIYYKRVADWSSSPKNTNSVSTTITTYNGSALKPNTTYYFSFIYKVNHDWHRSNVYSFTTKSADPCVIGHNAISANNYVSPTCGKKGHQSDTICKTCGVLLSVGASIPATGNHNYDSGIVTKAPTSSATGEMTYTCKTCGTKKTNSIAKISNATISNLTAKSKGFTVNWKKISSATGYQIQYSTSSNFSSPKSVTISKNSTISKSITKLQSKKKYYVRIRTYRTINGSNYYSSWSSSKAITTKK